jgi:hypothetical protein
VRSCAQFESGAALLYLHDRFECGGGDDGGAEAAARRGRAAAWVLFANSTARHAPTGASASALRCVRAWHAGAGGVRALRATLFPDTRTFRFPLFQRFRARAKTAQMGNGLFLEHLRAAEMPNIMGAPLSRVSFVRHTHQRTH